MRPQRGIEDHQVRVGRNARIVREIDIDEGNLLLQRRRRQLLLLPAFTTMPMISPALSNAESATTCWIDRVADRVS